MVPTPPRRNVWITSVLLLSGLVRSAASSLQLLVYSLLGKKNELLKPNPFLEALDYSLHVAPKRFWKRPTAIGAGRAIGGWLAFVFLKGEPKPKDPTTKTYEN